MFLRAKHSNVLKATVQKKSNLAQTANLSTKFHSNAGKNFHSSGEKVKKFHSSPSVNNFNSSRPSRPVFSHSQKNIRSFSSQVVHKRTLQDAFANAKHQGRSAFVAYITAGFPTVDDNIEQIKALQQGGADVIELGVPFTDPLADGTTIQKANQVALNNGIDSIQKVLELAKRAREEGVVVPFVLMGYCNPFLMYGDSLMKDCVDSGVDGFIVVDMPPEEASNFRSQCREHGLSYVPLVAPTTTDERLSVLTACADSFIYAVSVTGVTGAREKTAPNINKFLDRIRKNTDLPIAVGFGISTPEQFQHMGQVADGVVVGSAVIQRAAKGEDLVEYCNSLRGTEGPVEYTLPSDHKHIQSTPSANLKINDAGMFGQFGGMYVPETLIEALEELEREYAKALADPSFQEEISSYDDFIGRPSRFHKAERLTEFAGGATIWLKREDLNHTGAHKINNAVAQALLAQRIGKTRIICETGAGQHGVATATVCAKLGLPLTVYMGKADVERQQLNVFRMKLLGAKVEAVDSGSCTLKDAINEAMRDWVTNIHDTHYLVGSAIGPHPFPTIVRDFQSVIGAETKIQCMDAFGGLPDAVVACVGGGSNAIGMFYPFVDDNSVRLIGVEAGGDGVATGRHSAPLSAGTPGVLHGTKTYLMQDTNTGQIAPTKSISAGLDYPGVGPEHSFLKFTKRAEYFSVTDAECMEGFFRMSKLEGIIPALETSHAVFQTIQLARELPKEQNIVINISGRGDKDVDSVLKYVNSGRFDDVLKRVDMTML